MLQDGLIYLAKDMAITAIPPAQTSWAEATTGGKTYDLGSANRRIGPNMKLFANIHGAVPAAATSLRLLLYSGAAAQTTTITVADSGVIALATIVAPWTAATFGGRGYDFPFAFEPGKRLLQFLNLSLVHAGAAFTGAAYLSVGLIPVGGDQTAQTPQT